MKKGFLKAALGTLALTAMTGLAIGAIALTVKTGSARAEDVATSDVATPDYLSVAWEKFDITSDVNTVQDETALLKIDVTNYDAVGIEFWWDKDGYGGGAVGYNSVAKGDWDGSRQYSNDGSTYFEIDASDVEVDKEGKKIVQVQSWWTSVEPPTVVYVNYLMKVDKSEVYSITSDVNTVQDETALLKIDGTDYSYVDVWFWWENGGYGGGAVGYNSVAKGDWDGSREYSNDGENWFLIDMSDVEADKDGKKIIQVQSWWTSVEPPTGVYVSYIGKKEAEEDEIATEEVAYKIAEGDKLTYTLGDKKDFVITSDAPFATFVAVYCDDKEIDKKYYKAKRGSTVVTINADFMESLKEGDHKFVIVSEDGSATTTVTVKASSVTTKDSSVTTKDSSKSAEPNTGDATNVAILSFIAMIALGAVVMIKKKRV